MENTEGRKVIANNLEGRAFCAKDIERILRTHGWHHDDDTVEGKKAKGDKCPMSNGPLCSDPDYVDCLTYKSGAMLTSECYMPRPATIKDLIT